MKIGLGKTRELKLTRGSNICSSKFQKKVIFEEERSTIYLQYYQMMSLSQNVLKIP